jgi:hypothetical protein
MTTSTGSPASVTTTEQRRDPPGDTIPPPDALPSVQRQPAIHDTSSNSTNASDASISNRYSMSDNERVPPWSSQRSAPRGSVTAGQHQRAVDSAAPASTQSSAAQTSSATLTGTTMGTPSVAQTAPPAQTVPPASSARPLLIGVTQAELKHLLDAYDTKTLSNWNRLSRNNDENEQNMARLGKDLGQSLTGYPSVVQQYEQRVNDMQAQLSMLPPTEHEAYAGALATLDVAVRNSKDAATLQRADEQLSKLGNALFDRAATAGNDPVERALSVFNRPVGAGYLTQLGDLQQLSALKRLGAGFVTAATPAARERYFTLAADVKNNLQRRIGAAIDRHTTQEAGKWAAANAEVDRIVHEADMFTNAPGKRYELIGRQLFSINPGSGRDDFADRRLLAFTQRMHDDPALHDKLTAWADEAGKKLNSYGVDAQKDYLDILNNLPPAGPDYVRDLADQYNAVLHDTSYKDYSITPRARAEKLADQILEGTTRFLLGMTPLAPLTAVFDAHSSLSENARLGIDLSSGLLGLVASEGAAAFAERLAAKGVGVAEAAAEGHLPEHPTTTGNTRGIGPSTPPVQSGQAAVQSARPAANAAAQGLSVDAAVSEASQRITGTKTSLPDSYAVQPAPDSLKAAQGWKHVLIDNKGQHYITRDGKTYPARFDVDNYTWRVYQPNNAYRPQYPVRLNTRGDWEVHNNVGLKGGMNPAELPPPGPQQVQPFEESFRVSTPTGTPPSASMLQTLNPTSWHSDANGRLGAPEFTRRYQTAFDHLPADEQHALRNWTYLDISETYSGDSDYSDVNYDLNQQLRNRAYESDTATRAKALQTALSNLPRPDGDSRLLRIGEVPGGYARKFNAGDYVTNSPAFMSAASNNEYAEANLADDVYVVTPGSAFALYDIQSKSATPFVHRVTTLAPGEHEWLFRPNTVFRVDEIATATPQDGRQTPRIGIRLTEMPINEPTYAKNIYTGEPELVYPQGTTPVYTTLQPANVTPQLR